MQFNITLFFFFVLCFDLNISFKIGGEESLLPGRIKLSRIYSFQGNVSQVWTQHIHWYLRNFTSTFSLANHRSKQEEDEEVKRKEHKTVKNLLSVYSVTSHLFVFQVCFWYTSCGFYYHYIESSKLAYTAIKCKFNQDVDGIYMCHIYQFKHTIHMRNYSLKKKTSLYNIRVQYSVL